MDTHEMYEVKASSWVQQGKPDDLLLEGLPLAALRCWVGTERHQGGIVSPLIDAYLEASAAKQTGDWYWGILDWRDRCCRCGERYRIENLRICTACQKLYCYKHGSEGCSCGGELTG